MFAFKSGIRACESEVFDVLSSNRGICSVVRVASAARGAGSDARGGGSPVRGIGFEIVSVELLPLASSNVNAFFFGVEGLFGVVGAG